jgi:predicted chitinase
VIAAALAELDRIDSALAALRSLLQAPEPVPQAVPATGGLTDAAAFFNAVRGVLWPKLTADQVSGCETIMAACAGKMPLSWAAYALATAYHETAYTMQPIRERGGDAYLSKYDTGELAARLGNTPEADGDGIKYAGRGYVQLTGAANYRRASAELSAPLFEEPDLALKPDIAAQVLVRGMMEGWFTGKSLNDFIPTAATLAHFTNARRIINGADKAAEIAGYAVKFQSALTKGGWL